MLSKLITLTLNLPEFGLKKRLRELFYGEVVSERIVEYALVLANLGLEPTKKVKILDLGCYYSNFPIQLASMGYSVTAIDLMDYQLKHPNFKFIKGDITKKKLKPRSFNVVTSISTLEHIGLGFYKSDVKNKSGDKLAVEAIAKVLKNKGKFILTVPFGEKRIDTVQRVYDWESLNDLLHGFEIKKYLFYREKLGKWLPTSKKEAAKIKSQGKTRAMAFIVAIKK